MASFDFLVLGTGAMGSATLLRLAERGASVLGIDPHPPGHDQGSSHGQTRMIRQAYFEHPDYVPLVLRAYELWSDLERRREERLYFETGLLEIGPATGVVVPGVLAAARQHNLAVETLSADEVRCRFPEFRLTDDFQAVYEARAGYLLVERAIIAQLELAQQLGAKLKIGERVERWRVDGSGVIVETDRETYRAGSLIITAGAWASRWLQSPAGGLTVLRKPQYWYAAQGDSFDPARGCPAFLYETTDGVFYGFPRLEPWGVKMAEHSGGTVVDDPSRVDRSIDRADQGRVEAFARQWLSGVSTECLHHAVCLYTMSPDHHFIVDRDVEHPQIVVCGGLSGHGFKFAPVLGEALADLATHGTTRLPVQFLSRARFGG